MIKLSERINGQRLSRLELGFCLLSDRRLFLHGLDSRLFQRFNFDLKLLRRLILLLVQIHKRAELLADPRLESRFFKEPFLLLCHLVVDGLPPQLGMSVAKRLDAVNARQSLRLFKAVQVAVCWLLHSNRLGHRELVFVLAEHPLDRS